MAEKTGTKIDDAFNKAERFLTIAAIIPVIGTVAGLSKVLMGLGQSIVGVVGGILTSPARLTGNSKLNDRFWTHVKHGAGNMAAGTFEAIPLVGAGMYYARKINESTGSDSKVRLLTQNEDKFMPYKSLCERDFKFKAHYEEEIEPIQVLFEANKKTLAKSFDDRELTDKEKYKCAKLAIENFNNSR